MSRWIHFLIAILAGIGLGLLYGWVIKPVEYIDTTPDTLRIDYKADYVLMVAESYHGDHQVDSALRRLALLGNTPPTDILLQAINFAQKAGYTDTDLATMQELSNALQAYDVARETPSP